MGSRALRGRERETTAIGDALAGACAGAGNVVVISGPAGIGKSTLLGWLGEQAQARGAEVIAGRAWEFADAPPYFPLAACLHALALDPASAASPFVFWEHVLARLAHRARQRPVVLTLEDLHAADVLTLDLVVFLAHPTRSLPLLIAVTVRDQDPRLDAGGRARIHRLTRDGLLLSIGGLGAGEIAVLAAGCLGREPTPREVTQLVERSQGNPLFALELARAMARTRGAPTESMPPTIRQLVQDRLQRLPPACREAVGAGAILGRELAAGVVGRMLDRLPARIVDDLRPALDSGLLVEKRPGLFAFGHVLERDAIEDGLGASERSSLHARAAQALDRAEGTPENLLERARHALGGLGVVDEHDAVTLVERAIASLEAQGAHDRAYALWSRLEDARVAGTCSLARTAQERVTAARLARLAGRNSDARALCEEAIALARAAGQVAELGEAVLTLGAELRPGVVDGQLVRLLEETLRAAEPGSQLAVRIQARLAAALQPATDPFVPVRMAREAIARARASADDAFALEVLENAGSAIVDYAPVAERLECAHELHVRADRLGDHARALRALSRVAMDQAFLPDLAGFSGTVDLMLELSAALAQPRHRWRPLLMASMRACMWGRFDESERLLVEIDQLSAFTDEVALSLGVLAHRTFRLREVGTPDELRAAASESLQVFATAIPNGDVLTKVLAASLLGRAGDHDEVARLLASAEPSIEPFLTDLSLPSLMAEAVARSGSPALRRRLLAFFVPHEQRGCPSGHVAFTFEGPARRLIGLLEASLGESEAAEAHLRAALEVARGDGLAPYVARTLIDLGQLLGGLDRAREAAPMIEEGLRIADAIGLRGLPEVVATAEHAEARPADAGAPVRVEICRRGDDWLVSAGATSVSVRDVRGMQLLARLADHPGEEIHVLALSSDEGVSLAESHAGEQVDERARRAYRERLVDLVRELEQATADHDLGRVSRLERERSALEAELRGAFGLGGAARKAGSLTERARVNVQRRLKDAVSRITDASPDLGRRIGLSLKTGTYCSLRLLDAQAATVRGT